MRKLRAVLGLLVSGVLVLAGCGDDGSSDSSSGDGPIRVGVLLSGDGPLAVYRDGYRQGFDYWAEAQGEILGRPVELVFVDDGGEPSKAVPAAERLIKSERVDAVVGPYLSGPTSAVLPILDDAKMLTVNLSAFRDASDPEEYPYTFRVEWSKTEEARAMVQRACDLGVESLGLIVVDNPLGTETDDTTRAAVDDAPCDVTVTGTETFEFGATDVSSQLRRLSDADGLVVGAVSPADYAAVLNTSAEIRYDGYFFGNQAIGTNSTGELINHDDVLERIQAFGTTVNVVRPLPDETQTWLDGLKESLGDTPVSPASGAPYKAWDALELIRQSAEAVGSFDVDAMAEWLESNEVCGIWTCYAYSAGLHEGLTADQQVPFVANTEEDGFPLAHEDA